MATHFARRTLGPELSISPRLSADALKAAQHLPEHRRSRFLASRSLLAELVFMLYGIPVLPEIVVNEQGRPRFTDPGLADFSLAHTGNMLGVAITTEGCCGLDMELQPATRTFTHPLAPQTGHTLSKNETIWVDNQNDPLEARTQLVTLRRSLLKLTGQQNDDGQHFQLLPGAGKLRVAQFPHVEAACDAEDVLIWTVAVSPAIEKLYLWEYDSIQGWRSLPDMRKRSTSPNTRLMRFTSLPSEKAMSIN
ncbi:4'-phosphopantetheinyl transferase family protein [Cronobacter sakazakii]